MIYIIVSFHGRHLIGLWRMIWIASPVSATDDGVMHVTYIPLVDIPVCM